MTDPEPWERAQAAVLGCDDLLVRILEPLDTEDKARCEAVCQGWRAASRSAPQLWAAVKWRSYSCKDEPGFAAGPEALQWLGRRGPVEQAEIWVDVQDADVVAATLPCWAGSLLDLELVGYGPWVGGPVGFLASLQQLTGLDLCVTVREAADASCVSTLVQLRWLSWEVDLAREEQLRLAEDPELPLPPRLQRLRVASRAWEFPAQLSALAGLEMLELDRFGSWSWPSSLEELAALTALVLSECAIKELPASVGKCTGLRRLVLYRPFYFADSPEGAASLGRALRQLPLLENLQLHGCKLESLPALTGGPAPPLRRLGITRNMCAIPDAGWLETLEELDCHWWQVPAPELCEAAEAAATLECVAALPALRHLDMWHGVDWEGDRHERQDAFREFLAALHLAKPGLTVETFLLADEYSNAGLLR